MGLYDRDYTRAEYGSRYGDSPRMRMYLPRLSPAVKWLLIINTAVFILSFLIDPLAKFFLRWFSVHPATVGTSLQLWRLVTYQFLHDINDFGHIFWNMLILYFFGTMLERHWGSRKFLTFYLICGAMGGVLYPVLALAGWLDVRPLVGASGAILGIIAAGAVLFPNMRVYFFGTFPVRLVVIALALAGYSILILLRPDKMGNAGGQAAHLGGMVAGAVYVFSQTRRDRFKSKLQTGRWQKKKTAQRNLQAELDRILEKVHKAGIHSLTSKEKKILKQATEAERMRNKF